MMGNWIERFEVAFCSFWEIGYRELLRHFELDFETNESFYCIDILHDSYPHDNPSNGHAQKIPEVSCVFIISPAGRWSSSRQFGQPRHVTGLGFWVGCRTARAGAGSNPPGGVMQQIHKIPLNHNHHFALTITNSLTKRFSATHQLY